MTIETKLQIEALKMLDKGEKAPCYAECEKGFLFMLDGYSAVRIYEHDFYLNTEFLTKNDSLLTIFDLENLSAARELTVSNELRKISDKDIGVLLKCDNFTTCINEKYIKMFWDKSCKLYAKDEKSVIYFVRNDKIYAAVMPISLKKIGGNENEDNV